MTPEQSITSIEFLGLPGSGKSTLCDQVIGQLSDGPGKPMAVRTAGRVALRQRIRESRHPWRRLCAYALGAGLLRSVYPITKYEVSAYNHFCHGNPRLTAITMDAISGIHDPVRRDKVAKLWFKHCARHQLMLDHLGPGTTIFAPEGFLQKALSVFGNDQDIDDQAVDAYVAAIPLPRMLVCLQLDATTATERMADRPRQLPYPLSNMAPDQRLRSLGTWEALQHHLVQRVRAMGVPVVDIAAQASPSENATIILDRLRDTRDG